MAETRDIEGAPDQSDEGSDDFIDNEAEDSMYVKMVSNVQYVTFIQLTSFFTLLVCSSVVSKLYAWTKAVSSSSIVIFLWIKCFASMFSFCIGFLCWYKERFSFSLWPWENQRKSSFKHLQIWFSADLIASAALFYSSYTCYNSKPKTVMPFMYFFVVWCLSLSSCVGDTYILCVKRRLRKYEEMYGDEYEAVDGFNESDDEDAELTNIVPDV